jgi:hypothetical protein
MSGIEIFRGNVLDEIPEFVDYSGIRAGFVLFDHFTHQIYEVVVDKDWTRCP